MRVDGQRLSLELTSAEVADAAAAYLGETEHQLGGLELVRAASDDGQSATVTLRAIWHAPISTELVPVSVPIQVTATARSVFH